MNTQKNQRFGGAVAAALARVVNSSSSSVSVADAGTKEAFLDAWIQTLRDHARDLISKSQKLTAPVIIVFVPDTGEFAQKHQWKHRPLLGASHHDNFAGILAVGTGGVGACTCDAQLNTLTSFETEIKNIGLQSSPTIGLMSETKLLVWPDGIQGNFLVFDKILNGDVVAIDINAIDCALNDFYEMFGRQTKKWWKDATQRIVVRNPESTVQYALWVFLGGRLGSTARVKTEETIGNGRADITIIPIRPTLIDQSIVLELKTLRDVQTPNNDGAIPTKISQKENITWACSGIQQTAAYRDDNKMDAAFLCLYDFCAGNATAIDDAVKPSAMLHNVFPRRYWITATHDEHRTDRYPLAIT